MLVWVTKAAPFKLMSGWCTTLLVGVLLAMLPRGVLWSHDFIPVVRCRGASHVHSFLGLLGCAGGCHVASSSL